MTPFSFPGATGFVWVPDFTGAACFQQPFCIVIRQPSCNILCSKDACKYLDDLPVKFNSRSRGYLISCNVIPYTLYTWRKNSSPGTLDMQMSSREFHALGTSKHLLACSQE